MVLLIAAALEEELEAGLELCADREKIRMPGVSVWLARRNQKPLCFLRTGVGPKRSSERLDRALEAVRPSRILVIGYAGALDPELRLGDLIAVRRATALSLDERFPDWEHARAEDVFELDGAEMLAEWAQSIGIHARTGDVLTSSYVLGEPAHKRLLRGRFGASIVDMETAALARVSLAGKIPISSVRAVSDEVRDTFLVPFSHDPSTGIRARVGKLMDAGMVHTLREWKEHALAARKSLSCFLAGYL